MKTACLMIAALSTAVACDLESMGTQTEEMNSKCCTGANCDVTGIPSNCTDECRPAFTKFWQDCGAYMAYIPGTEPMRDFAAQCEDSMPDDADSNVAECDAGTLLTTLLFSCSGIDQNVAEEFCDTECERGVGDYIKRCKDKSVAASEWGLRTVAQAESWLKQCKVNQKEGSCHSARCNGDNDVHCQKANNVAECSALNAEDNNAFCLWQVCKNVGPPAPPRQQIRGCTDKKAINYNPKATQMADGSCLYHHTGPPPPPMPCNKQSFYGCKTKETCEKLNKQWVPCEDTVKYGGQCGGFNQQDDGQCINPCDENEPQKCHTPEKCSAASKPGKKTQWHVPPPPPPGQIDSPIVAPDRCEHACSIRTMYTCHTEEACKGIKMAWLPGMQFKSADKVVVRTNPARCYQQCTATNFRACHTKATCEALPEHQWIPSQCCGSMCEVSVPGNEAGSCAPKCSLTTPYNCHTQIACEAVGRQWIASTAPANPQCSNLHRGRCEQPCTEDRYFECRSKTSCKAIGLKWHAAVQHGRFMQEGRCTHKCSLANPSDCTTDSECTGIGYSWSKIQYSGGLRPPPGPAQHYCEPPCHEGSEKGCKSRRACQRIGNGQWVMRRAWNGGIDPRIEPRAIETMRDGIEKEGTIEHRRRAQAPPPQPPPPTRMIGSCEPKCSEANIYSCHNAKDCRAAEGKWTPVRNLPPIADAPQPVGGVCQPACSVAAPYACKNERQCKKIGGVFKTKVRLGMPSIKQCDVTNAPCDTNYFVAVCAGRDVNKIDKINEGVELCDDQCGRFIEQNYDRCRKHPPTDMSKAQWTTLFGPIVAMCKSLREDPSLSRCTNQLEEATNQMNKVCCTKNTHCAANHGAPTKCTGRCANTFVPFFQECGAIFLKEQAQHNRQHNRHRENEQSPIGRFYQTCTAKHHKLGQQDKRQCYAHAGRTPFVDIEFRTGCAVYIKYVDAKSHTTSNFVRLVAVGHQSIDQLLDVAKTVCGKPKMIDRVAEDFAGILNLANVDVEGNTLKITINHPETGNKEVKVTNTGANRKAVKQVWRKKFDVNVFNPEHCPAH